MKKKNNILLPPPMIKKDNCLSFAKFNASFNTLIVVTVTKKLAKQSIPKLLKGFNEIFS